MGIPGLTTYISNRSEQFLEDHVLHKTYLVVDGNSIACQLYNWNSQSNCAFGGDYDRYARFVDNFFTTLLKCEITPLVLFDGGCEDKKLKTVISRTRDRIRTSIAYSPQIQTNFKFFPIFLKETFKDVLESKGIRYAKCMFEADNAIAAVASMLNCPVLSYDSDFYVYGVLYIPFNTMDHNFIRISDGKYGVQCKIYRTESLLKYFHGLDKSVLPLAAILLGNDYVKRSTFKNFFNHMKLPKIGRRRQNEQQRRIEATLRWLSRYNLDNAISMILSRLPKKNRRNVLDIIENIMDSYTKLSANILTSLGFSAKDYFTLLQTKGKNKAFKFQGDVDKLEYIEEIPEEDDPDLSEEEEIDDEIINTWMSNEFCRTDAFLEALPNWFIDEFNAGHFPAYFVDLLIRGLYICPVQIECICCPSTILTCLSILNIIGALLRLNTNNQRDYIEYITRGEHKRMGRNQLKCCDSMFFCKLPSLENLRDVPLTIRKAIIDHTLEITDDLVTDLIPEWTLYIANINYWLMQQDEPHKLDYLVYSLLIALLFDIIDKKIGFYRNEKAFTNRYGAIISSIKYKRNKVQFNEHDCANISVAHAYKNVDEDDCLLAASFLLPYFKTDSKLHRNPKQFKVRHVHFFNEFQNCLRHTMNLNALLGYPYPQTKIATVYNGTLLYNLSVNLKRRKDILVYINSVLQQSPTLLQLLHVVSTKIKLVAKEKRKAEVYKKSYNYKKQRIKSKSETYEEECVTEVAETNEFFYDSDNRYTLLNINHQ